MCQAVGIGSWLLWLSVRLRVGNLRTVGHDQWNGEAMGEQGWKRWCSSERAEGSRKGAQVGGEWP